MGTATRLLPLLRVLFLLAVVVGITVTLVRLWPDVGPALSSMGAGALTLSVLAAAAYVATGLCGWRATAAELGATMPARSAARIYLVSQLGKYIPGSVWAAVAMVRLGQEAGLSRMRMAYSFALSLAFSILTGLLVGLPALLGRSGDYLLWSVGAFAIMCPLLLWPPLLNAVLDLGLRLVRRGRLEQPLRAVGITRILGWYLLAWLFGGLHVLALAVALGAQASDALFPSLSAFAVAGTLGVLFIIAPAGAGVRDVLMVLLLAGVVGAGGATAIALVSRVTLIVLDLAGAGGAALAFRPGRQPSPAPATAAGPDPSAG